LDEKDMLVSMSRISASTNALAEVPNPTCMSNWSKHILADFLIGLTSLNHLLLVQHNNLFPYSK